MQNAAKFYVMFITTPSLENARQLARVLVAEHLAACCNVVPTVYSYFSWKDALHEAQEALLIVKTHQELLEALQQRVTELHPYDVPEIIALPLGVSAEPYLQWLHEVLRPE
ncbi:MAG: divalent-cation tolerance protein CutA [Candidatus Kapabacteria bacterium]|nr:divalent-cation tolerance protein CutA [Candidatus Kapabacteria bacterium]MDW8225676.1 divalent-cation tolerance protein CutA [Bacteroidota bacterium]